MKTPAGKECAHYYEDYYRGREIQECRLIKANPASDFWKPSDCLKCPVPEILAANSSRDMELTLKVTSRFLGLSRTMEVTAWCLRHRIPIENPYTGCPKCAENRRGLDIFRQALEQDDEE